MVHSNALYRLAVFGVLAGASLVVTAAAQQLWPGARILDYLHARGEAENITEPQALRSVYVDYRDGESLCCVLVLRIRQPDAWDFPYYKHKPASVRAFSCSVMEPT